VFLCLVYMELLKKIFVITIAPQNLIRPQGRTYPTKAIIRVKINNVTPIFHVSFTINEFYNKFRVLYDYTCI